MKNLVNLGLFSLAVVFSINANAQSAVERGEQVFDTCVQLAMMILDVRQVLLHFKLSIKAPCLLYWKSVLT